MATDLYGNPLGKLPEYKLSLSQKRQAAMLYRWMSLDYLKGLKDLVDKLIAGVDVTLDLARRQGRDAIIANPRWGVRDTSANWSTYVYPALEEFRRSTIKDIALRATESYEFTDAGNCSRMLSEFSSMWMTTDEEEAFNKQWQAVYAYASKIDHAAGVGGRRGLDDYCMVAAWVEEEARLIPRLPRFRVRTDVEGETGRRPQRTGVYVPQDDPNGVLQFGWTGNSSGELGEVQTFNGVGLDALRSIGRNGLWFDEKPMVAFVTQALRQGRLKPVSRIDADKVVDLDTACIVLLEQYTTERPCKWYYVEMIDGEYDDEADNLIESDSTARLRCPAGQPCPQEGWWMTPAKSDSRRLFKAGEIMPSLGGDYGETIWQLDDKL